MKLELKYLAGYLPYNLRFKDTYAGDVGTYQLSAHSLSHWEHGHIKPFYPILRPLSDLTKEIEVNGEKFVPLESLYNIIVYDTDEEYYRILKREWDDIDLIQSAPYRFLEKLFEWHFDIYGLIENNLAIDINTL